MAGSRPYRIPRSAGASSAPAGGHVAAHGSVADNPVPEAFQRAFLASKARYSAAQLVRGLNAKPSQYAEIVGSLSSILGGGDPIPGGVGYGTFYTPQFQSGFTTGAEILWSAVCPVAPGGNTQTILYTTATNRAARGVEALAAYDPNLTVAFRVYDWSVPAGPGAGSDPRWVFNLSGEALTPFFTTIAVGGQQLRCLPIYNSTIETAPGTWTNSVLLHSAVKGWERQYSRSYSASLGDQHLAGAGDWGPIVETFQQSFSGTNPLGAAGVQLRGKEGPSWTRWSPLSAGDSFIRDDQVGFKQSYLQANYDWLITS